MYIEIVRERVGDYILASDIREATAEEIAEAKRKHENGKCDHSIVIDTPGWMYDIRHCAICGTGLGAI